MLHRSHTHSMQPTGRYQQKRISIIRRNSCTVNARSIFWSTTHFCGPRLPTQSSNVTSCPWPLYAKCLFLYRILSAHLNSWRVSISGKFVGLTDVGKLVAFHYSEKSLLYDEVPLERQFSASKSYIKKLPNCDRFWNGSPHLLRFLQPVTFKDILLLKMRYTKNNPTNKFKLNIAPSAIAVL